jgi:hypothetical protein
LDGGIVRNVVRWSIENLLEVNLYDNCAPVCHFLEVLFFYPNIAPEQALFSCYIFQSLAYPNLFGTKGFVVVVVALDCAVSQNVQSLLSVIIIDGQKMQKDNILC